MDNADLERVREYAQRQYDQLEGKAMHSDGEPWPRDKSADFERFIRRIGGFTPDGLPAGDPLDYDDAHFERATALIQGEVEPKSAAEVRALATWRARYES